MNAAGTRSPLQRHAGALAIGLALIVTSTAIMASRHQSTTFDEIFMVASGARGFETGSFSLANDHPPAMQYLYGLPVHLSGPAYPDEADGWDMRNRFVYAQNFYFGSGNDPERLAFISRMVAALLAGALVYAVFRFAAPRLGAASALLAALLVGFTPDVLAHGGVAYNDLPIALAFFLSLWAIDSAVREPSTGRVALAALAIGVAMSIKFSALALGPIALVILAMEAIHRGRDARWWRRVGIGVPLAAAVFYLTLVAANRGDFSLDVYRAGLGWSMYHSGHGHSVPAYFFGNRSQTGFWYFYPVVFLLKTPVALHLLMLIAAVGAFVAWRGGTDGKVRARAWLVAPMRPMLVAAVVFGLILVTANLNIGLRHALPAIPPLLLLTAAGLRYVARNSRRVRRAIAALVALFVLSTAAQYPNFLSYVSEYVVDRSRVGDMLADSSLDWGQGLIQLREWMEVNEVERVYLSYFGSAWPAAYGIDYVALTGYFQVLTPADTTGVERPRPDWMVVSATNRAGVYLEEDPFAGYRDIPPVDMIANHLYVYPVP